MFDEVLQKAIEIGRQFAESPTSQVHAMLAGILLVLTFRRRKKRTNVTITAEQGESVSVHIGEKKEIPVTFPSVKVSPDGFVKLDRK